MGIEKNTISANEGAAGNAVGDTVSQAAGMAQAALDAAAMTGIQTDAKGGEANADLDQNADATGASDNTQFGDFNVKF